MSESNREPADLGSTVRWLRTPEMLNSFVGQGVQLALARNCGCVWVAEWKEVRDCKVVSRLGIEPRTRRLRVASRESKRQRIEHVYRSTLQGVTSGSNAAQPRRNQTESKSCPQDSVRRWRASAFLAGGRKFESFRTRVNLVQWVCRCAKPPAVNREGCWFESSLRRPELNSVQTRRRDPARRPVWSRWRCRKYPSGSGGVNPKL